MRNLLFPSLSTEKTIWFLTIISCLFATRVMYIQHGWINDDSTLYFEIAKRFSQGEYRSGWALFQWPFYPLLIAWLHKLTSIDLHVCAQILAVCFFSLTTYALSKIIELIGGNTLTIICGILLLLGNTYVSGDVLAMLLRDQGFWAFFLLSLFFFIRYASKLQISDAIYWQLSILIATLFRIEAIAYAVLLPFTLLLQNVVWQSKLKQLLSAHALFLLLALMLILAVVLVPSLNIPIGRMKEITDLFSSDSPQSITSAFIAKSNIFAKQVLGGYLDDYAKVGLLFSLTGILIIKCVKITGVSGILLAISKKDAFALIEKQVKIILIACVIVAVLNAFIIILRSFVLSSRYVVALCFIAIIFAAFHFSTLIDDWRSRKFKFNANTAITIIIVIFTAYGVVKNIAPKRDDYHFDQHAVEWVKQNIDPKLSIHFDGARLRYYANAPWQGRGDDEDTSLLLDSVMLESKVDCIVARVKRDQIEKQQKLASLKNYRLLKTFFKNKSKTKIVILCK